MAIKGATINVLDVVNHRVTIYKTSLNVCTTRFGVECFTIYVHDARIPAFAPPESSLKHEAVTEDGALSPLSAIQFLKIMELVVAMLPRHAKESS
jgi:hypothetical protein